MIKGCTFDNQYVSSRTDGGLYESIFPGDGKVWGCSMSVTSSTLTIQPGELMIGGRILLVDGATQIDISNPIADGYGQIVLTIDLSKTSSTETFEQVELSVVYSATDVFPALTKGKINSQNGDMVYQAEMAVVSIAGGNVMGIVSQIADVLGYLGKGGRPFQSQPPDQRRVCGVAAGGELHGGNEPDVYGGSMVLRETGGRSGERNGIADRGRDVGFGSHRVHSIYDGAPGCCFAAGETADAVDRG